jgi:hypothetical protein
MIAAGNDNFIVVLIYCCFIVVIIRYHNLKASNKRVRTNIAVCIINDTLLKMKMDEQNSRLD